ncbi:PREDICTED: putative F-box/LRR-repeat protein 23 [Fragaria vesca subsp. vesca]|uniref:putative F-box/LRR-repeat protein 23 n=1 Tax=Fragaria vesca subsp. vesca TaxID=101020 RepID=UPI0002C2F6C1|nr:PREDICTED: putative F-box/LRR-repeat protein 23 [Fragaria vesca subsp. vesca]
MAPKTRQRRRYLRINRPREPKKQTLSNSRNWIDLPDDITASILSRLSMFDILERAQMVCLTWRRICKDPLTWRTIRMEFDIHLPQEKVNGNFTSDKREKHLRKSFSAHKMCRHAIHLSFGNLVDISIRNCGTDELHQHMTDSSRGIRRLSIVFSAHITMKGLSKVALKIPLLEDLEISYIPKSCNPFERYPYKEHESLQVIGHSCPLLKSLRWNKHEGDIFTFSDNCDAFAIARTMHGLQNLQLFGNWLSHQGLHDILEGCPRLESLDLRECIHLRPSKQWGWRVKGRSHLEDLRTRCFERIKNLRLPEDSTDDYEHIVIHGIVNTEYWEYMKDVMI